MREESDLSLEVVVLLIYGIFTLLFGLLLFKIHTGDLPYSPDSTYGLFLVMVSFQVITMGKTPFGDLRRSWALAIVGICTAILGMASCFIPGHLTKIVRGLVGIILFAGGICLLIQLFLSEKKAKLWMKTSGILQQLTVACGLVYALAIISGLITLFPGFATDIQTAIVLIIYGMSFFYLSWCIWKVGRTYPSQERSGSGLGTPYSDNAGSQGCFKLFREASLSLSPAILILLGILLTFLGLLLFPVNLGMLAFSPDGLFGMLLTVMAIQMMALGETPLGQYKRSRLMIVIGIVFAALGVVSCIVPGMLTGMVRILLGLLNIIGGSVLLIKLLLPILGEAWSPPAVPVSVPLIFKKLMVTQMMLNFVGIAFGISMLIPGLIPGLLFAALLVIYGLLTLIIASLLQKVSGRQARGGQQVMPISY